MRSNVASAISDPLHRISFWRYREMHFKAYQADWEGGLSYNVLRPDRWKFALYLSEFLENSKHLFLAAKGET